MNSLIPRVSAAATGAAAAVRDLEDHAAETHLGVRGAPGHVGVALERVPDAVPAELADREADRELALAVDLGLADRAEALAVLALGDRDRHARAAQHAV